MCLACDMDALWFAVTEARVAGETTGVDQSDAAAILLLPPQADEPLLPPPESERVGEGVAGGTDQAAVMGRESEDPHPNSPPEEGGESASAERVASKRASNEAPPNEGTRQRPRNPPRRFACEETSSE